MTILSTLASVSGIIGPFAMLPQAYKIFKRKSAKDISISTTSFFFVSAIIWIFYGFEIENFPIIISNLLGILSISLIIVGWFLYGRESKK